MIKMSGETYGIFIAAIGAEGSGCTKALICIKFNSTNPEMQAVASFKSYTAKQLMAYLQNNNIIKTLLDQLAHL
jgi:hypothetical protein